MGYRGMRESRPNAYAADPENIDAALRLAIARDLEGRLAGMLVEPLPEKLRLLVERLEEVTQG
jgi:hypothetical protein